MKRCIQSIVKSPNDTRQYLHITLKNGLNALLISDKETKESSCAMNVKVGYFNDPTELPGLAHFCEHMLFLGTEIYPTEGEYKKYLSQFSGSGNASTSAEYTTYYFTVNNEGFYGVMDRFASFFTCPLFTPDGTSREVNAVDSEFRRNLQADNRRTTQLLKAFINPQHPFSKFSTGNLETLLHSVGVDELRNRVLQLYSETYSAECMKLVCYGAEDLDYMREAVESRFSNVKRLENRVIPVNSGSLFNEIGKMKIVHLVPVKDIRHLCLYWELPSQYPIFDKKVNIYLNYLLEHQGQNSLFQYLRGKGYINNISAGIYSESDTFALYRVVFDLTIDGLANTEEIMTCFYQYLKVIETETLGTNGHVGERVFGEIRSLYELSFRWLEKSSPSSYTSRLSKRMQEYPIEDCLYAPYKFTHFDKELMEAHIKLIAADQMHVQIVAKGFENESVLVEPIYGTKYYVTELKSELLERLTNLEENPSLHVPPRNEFIAEDFALKVTQQEFNIEDKLSNPTVISPPDFKNQLWYKPTSKFNMPLAHYYSLMHISSDLIVHLKGSVMLKFYLSLVNESLQDVAYDAEMADLEFDINCEGGEGIEIFCGGFSDKLDKLIYTVYERLLNPIWDEQVFNRVKQNYIRRYKNHCKDQANAQTKYLVNMMTLDPFFAYERSLKTVEKLELNDIIHFFQDVIKRNPEFRVETFVNGNLDEAKSLTITSKLSSMLLHNVLPKEEEAVSYIRMLPKQQASVLELNSTNLQDSNSGVNVHFQLGERNLSSKVKTDLLAKIIKSYYFDTIRTKQQLGYSVHTRPIYYQSSLAFQFLVQGATHHPRDIYSRVKQFLETFAQILSSEIDSKQFDDYKNSLIQSKLKPHTKLLDESHAYWVEIFYQRLHWTKVDDEVAVLSQLTKDDLLSFFLENFISDERRELAVLVYGSTFSIDDKDKANEYLRLDPQYYTSINDIERFKKEVLVNHFPVKYYENVSYSLV